MKLWKVEIVKQISGSTKTFLPRMGAGWDQDGSEAGDGKDETGESRNRETEI